MDFFIRLAEHSPWFALSLALLYSFRKGCQWIGEKLFGNTGLLTQMVAKHSEFLDRTTDSSEKMVLAIMNQGDQLRALERKMESAYSVRHSDPELWALLFTNNPIPMALVSREGRYLNVNQALCRLTGWLPAELRQKTWQDITPAAELPADSASAEELAEGNSDSYRMKKHIVRKDGKSVPVELHAFRFPRTGEFRHFFSFYFPEN